MRTALAQTPLLLALIAAASGLAAYASQQSPSAEPLVVQTVRLPTSSSVGLIDLNTATVAELATLPGVGETRARAIVASRARDPFDAPIDLVDRGIILPTQLAAIAEQATVYVSFD